MARSKKIFLVAIGVVLFALASAFAQEKLRMVPGDINNLQMPSFDESTGFREWEVFGKKVKYISDDNILVSDMRLEMFTLDAAQKKKATFISKTATLSRNSKTAKSADTLFVEGDTFNLSGDDWAWSGEKRFVSLAKNVQVEFTAAKKDSQKEEKLFVSSNTASMDYSGDENKFEFKGSVKVAGEDFTIFCDKLKTQSPKKSDTSGVESLKEISASSNVKMRYNSGVIATSDSVKMYPSNGMADMRGNPNIVDENSKNSVWGERIVFIKSTSTATAFSSIDKSERARALIYASDSDAKSEKATIIYADKISMLHADKKNIFSFVGNVVVKSPDFDAYSAEIEAVAEGGSDANSQKISKIIGKKNVKFVKDGIVATGDEMQLYPAVNEVWLVRNAKLEDSARGVRLYADRISMLKDGSYANAYSNQLGKKTFIRFEIDESADVGLDGKPRSSVVLARNLTSQQVGEDLAFTFNRDVKIVSDDIYATCSTMDILAQKAGGANKYSINKIEAFNDVVVKQSGSEAQAQVAKIYPKVIEKKDGNAQAKRMMELGISRDAPDILPLMILPEISNIGLDERKQNTTPQKTRIQSKEQYFVSGKDYDTYVFENQVSVVGTDFNAKCDKLETFIKQDKKGKREIVQIRLSGNVEVAQGVKIAKAGRADILPKEEMITLSDSPSVLNEDGSCATGTRMIYTRGKKSISIENPIITLPKMK